MWTDFGRIEAVSGRTCPGFPLASGRIFVTGGRGCDFSSESLRYVGSCARKSCRWCPISSLSIANCFSVCFTAHLKAAPIVGSDPIRIGIESKSNRNRIGAGPDVARILSFEERYWVGTTYYVWVFSFLTGWGRYYILSILSLGILRFEQGDRGGTTY